MKIQGTVDDWRKDLLIEANNFFGLNGDSDIERVIWLTARDVNVCPLCAARDGKYFIYDEIKRELNGEFCKPYDEDDRCRCTFIIDEKCYKK